MSRVVREAETRPSWSRSGPTNRTAVLMALFAVAAAASGLGAMPFVVAATVLAGMVFADIAVARGRARATRSYENVIVRSQGGMAHLDVSRIRGRVVRLRQPVPPDIGAVSDECGGETLDIHLAGAHRGVHELPPAHVRIAGPLGIGSVDHDIFPTPEPVAVYPDLPGARRRSLERRRGRHRSDEGRLRSRLGLGTELESIRDYSPDDDIRQVNWRATARVGRPMSNQYRLEENRNVLCIVDVGRLMAAPLGSATRLDVALDAVAAVAVAAEDANDRVGTVAFADRILRDLPPKRKGAEAVVRTLFDLQPIEVESDYALAFQRCSGRKRTLMLIFTDVVDEAASRSLMEAVPVLARRHAVMVASCTDPDLRAFASAPPRTVKDVHEAAVAVEIERGRDATIHRMRWMGVTVVDTLPEKLGAACIAGYFALKARAIL